MQPGNAGLQVFEPVAIAFEGEDLGVVDETMTSCDRVALGGTEVRRQSTRHLGARG